MFLRFRVSAWTYRCIVTCPTTGQRVQSQPVTIEGIVCPYLANKRSKRPKFSPHPYIIHSAITLFYSFNVCKDAGKEFAIFQDCACDMSGGLCKRQIFSSVDGAETGWSSINLSSQTT